MAAAILSELAVRNRLPERYRILEISAHLRQQQREVLEQSVPALMDRVEWLDALPEDPMRGVVLANEVLDALPVKRFRIDRDGPQEWCVAFADTGLEWQACPADDALRAALQCLEQALGRRLEVGYDSEINLRVSPWLRTLADLLEAGVMLFVDYGYPRAEFYHPQRHMGTLICHYRHRAHDDPLFLPGLQDITAFVDFSSVADAGLDAGLTLFGYTTQAHFLMGAGLPALVEETLADGGADDVDRLRLIQQAKTLMMPGEMGERFQVMALGRGYDGPLAGFAVVDHRGRL